MTNPKSILDICRALPGSEGELREQWAEFGEALTVAVFGVTFARETVAGWLYPIGRESDADITASAKAATDAMVARGWRLEVASEDNLYRCNLWPESRFDPMVEVWASTEELARSAAALLAAHSILQEIT